MFYFSLDRKVAKDQEPHEALAAQGHPKMASVPAVTSFCLPRFAYALATLLKQNKVTLRTKPTPLRPSRVACGSDQYIKSSSRCFSTKTVI
jgi:hypothetical protein